MNGVAHDQSTIVRPKHHHESKAGGRTLVDRPYIYKTLTPSKNFSNFDYRYAFLIYTLILRILIYLFFLLLLLLKKYTYHNLHPYGEYMFDKNNKKNKSPVKGSYL